MRLAFFIILLQVQAWSAIADYVPAADCGNVFDCVSESPNAICALDRELVCFKSFDSLCHLKYEECQNQREFPVYLHAYCENSAFMCNN
ncbi:uncharacterized protein LOC105211152 [Zeugodacus cucurbitae]|uniref:uncharacterized protein LOC105211152 n=1 Tax=Zeugodacus cucurbitae TaxID=28588 RepID=UPI000596AAE1|nr:uncharacterized protein LOC105211152 [Zeugodacus cucurbitae]